MLTLRREQMALIASGRQARFVERLSAHMDHADLVHLARIVEVGLRHFRTEADLERFVRIVSHHGLLVQGELPSKAVKLLSNQFVATERRLDSLQRWARREQEAE